ncbi:hypothetical protein ACFY8S_01040 [Streptomyces hygroscopicus]|uniref:hypothetical protein n=1 Tax=Streptomyces hygroscopicus TaxID=1912 RepID=UPI0036C13ACD
MSAVEHRAAAGVRPGVAAPARRRRPGARTAPGPGGRETTGPRTRGTEGSRRT